jgi:intein/homing endonuclease
MRAKNEISAKYLRGLFDADGGVFDRFVHLDVIDKTLLETIQLLLLRFGILSGIRKNTLQKNANWNHKQSYRLDITDFNSLELFAKQIGFTKKSKKDFSLSNMLKKQSKKKRNSMLLSPITYGIIRDFVRQYNIPRKIFNPQIIYSRTKIKRMNYTTLNKHFIEPILKNKKIIDNKAVRGVNFLNAIYLSDFQFFEIKKKTIKMNSQELIDLSIPKTQNFIANGLVAHNSIAAGCKVPAEKLDEFLSFLEKKLAEQLN